MDLWTPDLWTGRKPTMSCSATIYQRLVTICLRMFLRGNVQKLPSIMISLCVSFAEAELPDVLLLGCHKSKLNFKGHWETLLNHMWVVFCRSQYL